MTQGFIEAPLKLAEQTLNDGSGKCFDKDPMRVFDITAEICSNGKGTTPSAATTMSTSMVTQGIRPEGSSSSVTIEKFYSLKLVTSSHAFTYPSPTTKTRLITGSSIQCPPGGWIAGCHWGSGPGQLGDRCTFKTDCMGEYICVAGVCTDNLVDRRASTEE